MTIAAGVICPDGIVMCADSQETVGEYLKVFKPKLIELSLVSPDVKAVVVASGNGPFIDTITERISEHIDLVNPYGASIKQAVQAAVSEACSEIWPHYTTQADKPTARLLVGVRASDGMTLLDAIVPIVNTADRYSFIGWGGDLATYKAKQLVLDGMTVSVAAPILAYILDVVKKNVEYCGGDTRLAIITADGRVEHKPQDFVASAAQGFENTAWGLEVFFFPLIAASRMPDGQSTLAAIAELGKPDAEMERKIVDAISKLAEARTKGIPLELPSVSPEQKLSASNFSWLIALNLMQTAEKNLHDAGCVADELHKKIQERLLLASKAGQEAGASLRAGDLKAAKESLRSAVRMINDQDFSDTATPLIAKTLESKQ